MPDAMDIPGWCEFQAARQRFMDGLAADAANRRARRPGRSDRLVLVASRPAAEEPGQRAQPAQCEPGR